ncbi:MAG: trypsin-like peptidase domain-containing protein, partial [Thermogemmata sp.]|nr:trypsin-like peptidase domain-containing protein [Thermogemmata sp.]
LVGLAKGQRIESKPVPPQDIGQTVYRKVVASSTLILTQLGQGSGALVDRGRRLVLTNFHVVGKPGNTAYILFPIYDHNGKVVADRKVYTPDKAILGKVVEVDANTDLALVRLMHIPPGIPALVLAKGSVVPGQTIHTVGNPGASGALWNYTSGRVRQVFNDEWQGNLLTVPRIRRLLEPENYKSLFDLHMSFYGGIIVAEKGENIHFMLNHRAKVVETDSALNPGNSGGPVVNDNSELVGVAQGMLSPSKVNPITRFIDISHVRRLLFSPKVQAIKSEIDVSTAPNPAALPRYQHLISKDEGRFFDARTWKQIQNVAAALYFEKEIDLVVETYERLPVEDVRKVAELNPVERQARLRKYAQQRMAELDFQKGLYVLITRLPASVLVERKGDIPAWPVDLHARLNQQLLEDFRQRQFDAGIEKFLKTLLEITRIE